MRCDAMRSRSERCCPSAMSSCAQSQDPRLRGGSSDRGPPEWPRGVTAGVDPATARRMTALSVRRRGSAMRCDAIRSRSERCCPSAMSSCAQSQDDGVFGSSARECDAMRCDAMRCDAIRSRSERCCPSAMSSCAQSQDPRLRGGSSDRRPPEWPRGVTTGPDPATASRMTALLDGHGALPGASGTRRAAAIPCRCRTPGSRPRCATSVSA